MAYSREVRSIIGVVAAAGLQFRVTDVNTPKIHADTSWHYAPGTGGKGTAVDFGGVTPGTSAGSVAQMAAIWGAFRPHAPKLAELFFQSPETLMVVKNGVWRPGLATLGRTIWDAHRNHVHVAVKPGVFLIPEQVPKPVEAQAQTVPIRVSDYEEAAVKTMMVHIGKLDDQGRGWSDWNPGFGRDPNIVAVTLLGPSPGEDGYWPHQEKVQLSAQPRGGAVRVVVRGGTPGDTVTCWVTVS